MTGVNSPSGALILYLETPDSLMDGQTSVYRSTITILVLATNQKSPKLFANTVFIPYSRMWPPSKTWFSRTGSGLLVYGRSCPRNFSTCKLRTEYECRRHDPAHPRSLNCSLHPSTLHLPNFGISFVAICVIWKKTPGAPAITRNSTSFCWPSRASRRLACPASPFLPNACR